MPQTCISRAHFQTRSTYVFLLHSILIYLPMLNCRFTLTHWELFSQPSSPCSYSSTFFSYPLTLYSFQKPLASHKRVQLLLGSSSVSLKRCSLSNPLVSTPSAYIIWFCSILAAFTINFFPLTIFYIFKTYEKYYISMFRASDSLVNHVWI